MRQRYPSGLTNLTPNSVRLMKKELAKCPQSELARLERGLLTKTFDSDALESVD